MKKHLLNILLWSVVTAAFIGPGTVTTAAAAGTNFQTSLLWALTFSIMACIVLQEAVARLNAVTGLSLGEVIKRRYPHRAWLAYTAGGMVVFGCMAYQAGNILGAAKGVSLVTQLPTQWITIAIVLLCLTLLITSSYKSVARILGFVVAVMGMLFLSVSFHTTHSASQILHSMVTPAMPEGSIMLAVGLIGTTIVPYNLFLASDLAKGQSVTEMRISLSISILLGGVISASVLLVGTLLVGEFSFEALGSVIEQKTGAWGYAFLGFGLFAAGFTSSVTAPLASALTMSSLVNQPLKRKIYRFTWITVLFIGGAFGLFNIKPIPAIILAQAVNGLLLPIIAIFLIFAVNDEPLLGHQHKNPWLSNLLMLMVIGVVTFLGMNHLVSVVGKLGIPVPSMQETSRIVGLSIATALVLLSIIYSIFNMKK